MSFGTRINQALARKGASQQQLADGINVSKGTVSGWVHDRVKQVYPEHLIRAADWLGVSVKWLALNEGPMDQHAVNPHGVDISTLEGVLRSVEELTREKGRIPPETVAKLVAIAYEYQVEEKTPMKKGTLLRLVHASR